jgi:hypothetical protein
MPNVARLIDMFCMHCRFRKLLEPFRREPMAGRRNSKMTKIRLKYIHEFADRHGKVRRYVRLPGGKRFPLPGAPGTETFMQVYAAALAGAATPTAIASRSLPGSVDAAIASYLSSAVFAALAPDTRGPRRRILEGFRVEHGDKRAALLQRAHIDRMVAAKAATPGVARNFISAIRAVMTHCVALGWRGAPRSGRSSPAPSNFFPPLRTASAASGEWRSTWRGPVATIREMSAR